MHDKRIKPSEFKVRAARAARAARETRNSAGGYVFAVDDMKRLHRFLILGVDGGTYYAKPTEYARENAGVVFALAKSEPQALVDAIVDVSANGRAPRQNPALFALAVAASVADDAGRSYALEALPKVARTSTHLFMFVAYAEQFRGWGRALRRAVASWYTARDASALEYQAVKYRQRDGWTHRDLLRLSHPKTDDEATAAILDWMAHRTGGSDFTRAFEEAQRMVPKDLATALRADRAFSRLPWEALPSEALNSPEVWRALLDNDSVPLGALMRQLPRLTKLGVLGGVAERLTDAEAIKRARLHPLALLVALKTYASGHGLKGSLTWTPVHRICDVLDEAFYLSFDAVEPTGRRTLLALDISGSMGYDSIAGLPITPREASAALAMVTAKSEREYEIVGFTAKSADSFGWNTGAELTPLDVSPRRRLDDNLCAISGLPMGATDCALPMVWAKEHGKEFDSFEILTDNETFAGDIKPTQALAEYRRASGIDARLAVVGMTSSGFSIADPTDVGQLDVVGFDTSTPNVISDFFRG